ncbi:hypothetical protein ABEB36_009121 [Hypothenemus hampei]|uniref:Cytoplasmic tRNA 2-thiolation protein 2 n=1 Tax=Hypothenemus hampei TaxID=57062 RepID=A0ABD1EP86_HYPHA
MCSLDDNFENKEVKHFPKVEKINLRDLKCNKCRENIPVVLLRHKDAYCKECFLAGATHKFKALLGKTKLIRPHDRVLISYEVGHPSTALLHFLRSGLDLNTPKQLRFEPVIVFLEDQWHLTVEERIEIVEKVKKEISWFKFQVNLVSFADSVCNNNIVISQMNLELHENNKENINSILKKHINRTNKKEVLNILRRNILISIAKKLNCRYIITPELSVDIATNLLTNICLGKGSQVPDDTGFCDHRDKDVKILRPLRTFDMKEVAFYNIFNNLTPVTVRQPDVHQYSSIQTLVNHFITDLQDNYPATVTTIVKTGDKLASGDHIVRDKCKLCQGIILEKTDELNSEESTKFSRLLSNELIDHALSREDRYLKIKYKFDSCTDRNQRYCFSCSKISEFILLNDTN